MCLTACQHLRPIIAHLTLIGNQPTLGDTADATIVRWVCPRPVDLSELRQLKLLHASLFAWKEPPHYDGKDEGLTCISDLQILCWAPLQANGPKQ